MRSGRTSRTTTSFPRSAKHAPVTRPTYPAPKIAIRATGPSLVGPSATERPEALRDGDHRSVRELVQDRVRDPVDRFRRAHGDHLDRAARRVDQELPVVVEELPGRAREDGRCGPVALLDLPVLDPVRLDEREHDLVLVLERLERARALFARQLRVLRDLARSEDREVHLGRETAQVWRGQRESGT